MNIITLFILILIFNLNIHPSYAYLDPGSGSFIFQMIIGAVLGGLFTLKIYFHKIKKFITNLFKKNKK